MAVTDEAQGQSESSGDRASSTSSSLPPQNVPVQWTKLVEIIKTRKIDFGLWLARLLTIGFGCLYLIPIYTNASSYYYKALLAAAATSSLRLHQRFPSTTSFQSFFTNLILEDSCHYIFYCLIFIYCQPITLALLPIELFAILHFASFSLTLLDALGRNNLWIGRLMISVVEFQTVTILRMAAAAEIMIFLFTIVYIFAGKVSIITPFIYYRFLTLRYASRRNHYTRVMFAEMRLQIELLSRSPRCPSIISSNIIKGINLISRMAPPIPPPAT